MAYSTIYNVISQSSFDWRVINCYRPYIDSKVKSCLRSADKTNQPVDYKWHNTSYVAFPSDYKVDTSIFLSRKNQDGNDRIGEFKVSSKEIYQAVILTVKFLLVDVIVPVRTHFHNDVIKQALLDQTHTLGLIDGCICVTGKFKFLNGFLELDFEE